MQITKYICDRCHKPVSEEAMLKLERWSKCRPQDPLYDICRIEFYSSYNLCTECLDEFINYVENFLTFSE